MALGTGPFYEISDRSSSIVAGPVAHEYPGVPSPSGFLKKKKTKSMHVLRLKLRGSMLCALFISKDKSSSLKFCELSLELVLLELLGGSKRVLWVPDAS